MIHPNRFAGKVAVVTGAAQGIGRYVALAIAREGGRVAMIDRSELVAEVCHEVEAAGAQVIAINCRPGNLYGCHNCHRQHSLTLWPDRHPDQQCGRHHLGQAVCGV
jgi:NAD(P)-dependent dehydrogenase (short-subunit alcohol dehydrogenase family)